MTNEIMKRWILTTDIESNDEDSDVTVKYKMSKLEGCFCPVRNIFPFELSKKCFNLLKSQNDWVKMKEIIRDDVGVGYDSRVEIQPNSITLPLNFTPSHNGLKILWQISGYSPDCIIVHEEIIDIMLDIGEDNIFTKNIGSGYYIMKILKNISEPINRKTKSKCPGCSRLRFGIVNEQLQIDKRCLCFDGNIGIIDTTGYIVISDELKERLGGVVRLNAVFETVGDNFILS